MPIISEWLKITGNGNKVFDVKELYKDNTVKLSGRTLKDHPLVLEGDVIAYYPNGKKKSQIFYIKGLPSAEAKFYHANGTLKKAVKYIITEDKDRKTQSSHHEMISFLDSAGTELVSNGSGFYKDLDESLNFEEEGNYKDGLKNGLWKGKSSTLTYEELYENGELISGNSVTKDGQIYPYKKLEELPEYKGGINNFYQHVARNFNYPSEAKQYGISGTVIISFVVEKNGELTDLKVVKDPGKGTAKEAMRVIQASKKWIPGRQRGLPVRVSYTIPIKLNLSAR